MRDKPEAAGGHAPLIATPIVFLPFQVSCSSIHYSSRGAGTRPRGPSSGSSATTTTWSWPTITSTPSTSRRSLWGLTVQVMMALLQVGRRRDVSASCPSSSGICCACTCLSGDEQEPEGLNALLFLCFQATSSCRLLHRAQSSRSPVPAAAVWQVRRGEVAIQVEWFYVFIVDSSSRDWLDIERLSLLSQRTKIRR